MLALAVRFHAFPGFWMGATTSGLSAVPPCYGSTAENGGGGGGGGGGGNGGGDNHEGSLRLPAFVSRKTRSVSGLSGTSCVGFLSSSASSPHPPAACSPVASSQQQQQHYQQQQHHHQQQQPHNGCSSPNGLSQSAKSAKLSTLRKKMSRFRRKPNISTDYGKQMRDFIASWSYRELLSLRQEYEALSTLKELSVQAMNARSPVRAAKSDLSVLFESQLCADAQLSYHGAVFPVHRAILCARCSVFKQLFASTQHASFSQPVPVQISTPGISLNMFACLLKYLYTGQISVEAARFDNWDTLGHLCQEFGTPNLLERDLKVLLDSAAYSDCLLVFSSAHHDDSGLGLMSQRRRHLYNQHHLSSPPSSTSSSASSSPAGRPPPPLEVPCHRALLAARSKFFHNLVLRRDGSEALLRIVLDEAIVPRKFALVLLNAFYTDRLDLTLLLRNDAVQSPNGLARHPVAPLAAMLAANSAAASAEASKRESYPSVNVCGGSHGALSALGGNNGPYNTGGGGGNGCNPSLRVLIYEVTELFQIAQFLEFGALVKG